MSRPPTPTTAWEEYGVPLCFMAFGALAIWGLSWLLGGDL